MSLVFFTFMASLFSEEGVCLNVILVNHKKCILHTAQTFMRLIGSTASDTMILSQLHPVIGEVSHIGRWLCPTWTANAPFPS